MGEVTKIAWARASFSPWIGCTKVSPGCDACYAEALDSRYRYGNAVHWGPGVPRKRTQNWAAPVSWNKKAKRTGEVWTVFPSLCDPFDNEVPAEWFADFVALIEATPALSWLLLTKRIGNVEKMLRGVVYPNVWIGASIVNQAEADRDLPKLLASPAAKRFVSYEPALGPIDFARYLPDPALKDLIATFPKGAFPLPSHLTPRTAIDWGIVGGESNQGGAKARPFDLAWARSFVAQFEGAGVPPFVKQLGSSPVRTTIHDDHGQFIFKDRAGADPAEWPDDLRVQQFPRELDAVAFAERAS